MGDNLTIPWEKTGDSVFYGLERGSVKKQTCQGLTYTHYHTNLVGGNAKNPKWMYTGWIKDC